MKVLTINPTTEQRIAEYDVDSSMAVELKVSESVRAQATWRKATLSERLLHLEQFARGLKQRREELATWITLEMGKVKKEAYAEVDKCAASCDWLREHFPTWKSEKEYTTAAGFSVHYEALGPILGIMPWNFPAWQVVRFAIPALLCGNSVLLKHAPNVWGASALLRELFQRSFPTGLYEDLRVEVPALASLIQDRRVRGVSLTGSRRAGQSVAALAGESLKKCVLELGGSDAYVILDDADVELASDVCARSRLLNAGQSCVAAKRFIVTRKNLDAFTQLLRERMSAVKIGDPLDDGVGIGPLARKDLRDHLDDQVRRSMSSGAELIVAAPAPPTGLGYFYPISLLLNVRPGQPAFDEELFGPVAAVISARDEEEAFELANRSCYGLGGAIFSRDVARAKRLAVNSLECGMAFVNDMVRSDADVPFGGIKDSGLGRELGREGSFEFTNIKTVYAKGSV